MSPWELLWMLPLCAVISVVYSATRSDDWHVIGWESVRRFAWFLGGSVVLGLALMLMSKYVQTL